MNPELLDHRKHRRAVAVGSDLVLVRRNNIYNGLRTLPNRDTDITEKAARRDFVTTHDIPLHELIASDEVATRCAHITCDMSTWMIGLPGLGSRDFVLHDILFAGQLMTTIEREIK